MWEHFRYYHSAFWVTVVGILLSGWVGYSFGGGHMGAVFAAMWTTCILAVLEISLSIDNAVVNVKTLAKMDEVWQHRFITWGMAIAVFGMRFVFPLVIVGVSLGMAPVQNPFAYLGEVLGMSGGIFHKFDQNVLSMAISSPEAYSKSLSGAHAQIMGFGGAFLFMVFLNFFIDEAKEHHWITPLESKMVDLSKFGAIQLFFTIMSAYILSKYANTSQEGIDFFNAAVMGALTFVMVNWLEVMFKAPDLSVGTAKLGLSGFIYLEVLDASFSFDGVIGAFALTNNIFIIMIGLAIGAMFVRSATIHMLHKGTLGQFKYLEHAAFWAIGVLATIMYLSVIVHVPEVITGVLGAAILAIGVFHSIKSK